MICDKCKQQTYSIHIADRGKFCPICYYLEKVCDMFKVIKENPGLEIWKVEKKVSH